ncbi:MAG: hypothetical protein HOV81_15920 [Kofleriaceae bacterium]|nr:hypothetical protein [Kofleriaceae bacterium]
MSEDALQDGEACEETPTEHHPRWLKWVTRISLVIGITALVVTTWIVGPSVILEHLRTIGWVFLGLCGIEILSSICDGTAVYYMSHGPGQPTWRHAVVAQLAGRGVNAVTPGGNLGEALKVSLLSHECSPRRIVAAVMYVNLVAVVISFTVVGVGSAATAFLFDVPTSGAIALCLGGVVGIGIAVGIVVLVRRGMLSTLSNALAHVRIISKKRRESWNKTLEEVDARLRGSDDGAQRRKAIAFILISQSLQKALTYLTVLSAGYALSAGQFLALLSAGVLLGWVSTIIPMGLGISEGGNVALFSVIGAPPALGLALAFARRVNQIVFAVIGFVVLTADRLASRVHGRFSGRSSKWSLGDAQRHAKATHP